MKALFITHDVGIYGAARSLALLLGSIPSVEVTLAIPKPFPFQPANDLKAIRERFGPRVVCVKEFHLPRHRCYDGSSRGIVAAVRGWIRGVVWAIYSDELYSHIETHDYDYIHLNSIVLNPVIRDSTQNYILHMREVVYEWPAALMSRLKTARGVICIDKSTASPLSRWLPHLMILNNPFDMREVGGLDRVATAKSLGIDITDKVIVGMIGSFHEVKGNDFVIRAFRKSKNPNLNLLFFGGGRESVVRNCRALAKDDPRIKFVGEVSDSPKIYAICDYVIRGDPTFRIGRTIYEGLYSDCDVILPGCLDDIRGDPELSAFNAKLHVYAPRDEAALTVLFESIASSNVKKKNFRANVEEYAKKFDEFVRSAISRH
jgi:glycosyltransferase involved in cell wall biosynthesis